MNTLERYQELHTALDAGDLMEQARREAGLADFGSENFIVPLRQIQECYARESNFHAKGLDDFKKEIVRELVNRLRYQEDLKQHPEISAEDVSDPIVIIGLPRSGTTKTHRMMGTDANLLKTVFWQLINPARFPNVTADQPDPRIMGAIDRDSLLEDSADIRAAHFYATTEVQEDVWLFGLTFNDDYYRPGRTPSPAFQNWARTRTSPSNLDNYRYVHGLFQYLQWQQGGRQNRRWLMKHTGHMLHLEELLDVYPKATVVHIHRHPESSIPSLAKLSWAMAQLRLADVDPHFIGNFHFERTKYALDRYMESRKNAAIDSRIFDVRYEQIRNDPMPVIRELYQRAGHGLTGTAERCMLQWQHDNEQGKHGAHIYSLEQFGLSSAMIQDQMGEYIRRFV